MQSFQKFSGGDTPGPSQREGPPSCTNPSPAFGRARGASASCWDPYLGLPQLFSRGCAPAAKYNIMTATSSFSNHSLTLTAL